MYHKEMAKLLKEDFLRDCSTSAMLTHEDYLQRSWGKKLKEGIGKVLSPLF
jgi:cardiolipin synthase